MCEKAEFDNFRAVEATVFELCDVATGADAGLLTPGTRKQNVPFVPRRSLVAFYKSSCNTAFAG